MPKDAQRFRKIYTSIRLQPIPETTAGASVDTAGLDWKESCRVATTANISLTPSPTSIDGVTLDVDDRILVKDQSSASQNGIYYFDGTDFVRTTDASGSNLTSGAAVYIEEGNVNSECSFVLTTHNPITVGSTSLTWIKFAGAGSAIFTSITSPGQYAKTDYMVSFDTDLRYTSAIGSDVYFFVSGSDTEKSVFGGDVVISGTSHLSDLRLGGLLLNSGGTNLINAGTGITINQDATGIEIGLTPSVGGGSSTPPTVMRFLAGTSVVDNDSVSKNSLGMDFFDYNNLPAAASSLQYFYCAIGKPASGTVGYMDLYDYSGMLDGIPGAITGSTLTFTSTSSYECVSASLDYLTGSTDVSIFESRAWCSLSGTNLNFTCKGAWLEIRTVS